MRAIVTSVGRAVVRVGAQCMNAWPGMAESFWRAGKLCQGRPKVAASRARALTEFVPALRCYYPGQPGILRGRYQDPCRVLVAVPLRFPAAAQLSAVCWPATLPRSALKCRD